MNVLRIPLLLFALALFAACAGTDAPPREPVVPPAVRGAEDGLELWTWVVQDAHGDSGPLLSPFLDFVAPIDAATRERLEHAGLRVLTVPVEELAGLQARLPIVGGVQRQWLGQVADWTAVVRGPTNAGVRPIRTSDGTIRLDGGRLDLMLRCWIVPMMSDSGPPEPVLRVELVPRHLAGSRFVEEPFRLDAIGNAEPLSPRGVVFSSLLAELALERGWACVIVPEAPGVEWPRPAPTDGELGPPPGAQGVGPPGVETLTVGEALLASEPDRMTGRRARAILVLVPRLSGQFALPAR